MSGKAKAKRKPTAAAAAAAVQVPATAGASDAAAAAAAPEGAAAEGGIFAVEKLLSGVFRAPDAFFRPDTALRSTLAQTAKLLHSTRGKPKSAAAAAAAAGAADAADAAADAEDALAPSELLVDGFDSEQIWQQLQSAHAPALRSVDEQIAALGGGDDGDDAADAADADGTADGDDADADGDADAAGSDADDVDAMLALAQREADADEGDDAGEGEGEDGDENENDGAAAAAAAAPAAAKAGKKKAAAAAAAAAAAPAAAAAGAGASAKAVDPSKLLTEDEFFSLEEMERFADWAEEDDARRAKADADWVAKAAAGQLSDGDGEGEGDGGDDDSAYARRPAPGADDDDEDEDPEVRARNEREIADISAAIWRDWGGKSSDKIMYSDFFAAPDPKQIAKAKQLRQQIAAAKAGGGAVASSSSSAAAAAGKGDADADAAAAEDDGEDEDADAAAAKPQVPSAATGRKRKGKTADPVDAGADGEFAFLNAAAEAEAGDGDDGEGDEGEGEGEGLDMGAADAVDDDDDDDDDDGAAADADVAAAAAAAAGAKPASNVLSTFERRELKMRQQIEALEALNTAAGDTARKPWDLKGEVSVRDRPADSLLNQHLEFDVNGKLAPAITQESTLELEEIIRRRIRDAAWDDVERITEPRARAFKPKDELSTDKPKLGLAEQYEGDFLRQMEALNPDGDGVTGGSGTGGSAPGGGKASKLEQQHAEITALFAKLCFQLDSLTNFHFTPRPPAPTAHVTTHAPAIAMEEVTPLGTSAAQVVAPREVFASEHNGAPRTREEMSREEKRAARGAKRTRRQKKARSKAEDAALQAKATGKPVPGADKAAAAAIRGARNVTAGTTSGGDAKRFNRSAAFFGELQDATNKPAAAAAGAAPAHSGGTARWKN